MISIENSTLKEIWAYIERQLQVQKEPYQDVNAVYEFQILDEVNGIYQLHFENEEAAVYYTSKKVPNCVLKMNEKYFKLFLLGDLNSTKAFMTGKLKIKGNLSLALKLETMLKQYQLEE